MPGGKNVSKNISEYSHKHPDASRTQKIAAGINMAREAGANIPQPKSKPSKKAR